MAAANRCLRLVSNFLMSLMLALIFGAVTAETPSAKTLVAATATNFAEVLQELKPLFETETGHDLTIVTGSTGKLYAQIEHGAPFDVFLAADQQRPERLVTNGTAVAGSRATYAIGRLTLWSSNGVNAALSAQDALTSDAVNHIAIANPELAPYGLAAQEVLRSLGLADRLAHKIVTGENIGQAYAMVATGNAEVGFISSSTLLSAHRPAGGVRWEIPSDAHEPIRQDAVLLQRGTENAAALMFLKFLVSEEAQSVIRRYGYDID